MADNTTLPGTGDVIAADDVGGVKYQQVKLVDGTLDSSTPIGTNSNPLKATGPDCVSLLFTTLTVEGASASMDTSGYGAVVAQISGVWQGNCTFEASNDGTVWDTVLVFSRDNLSLQDIITSGGLFTVRPSGRYLRINVQEITGSMVINALGRAAEGIAAADILSLAMDRQNNTPLNVSLLGVKQDTQGALVLSDGAGPFYASASTASATFGILTIDTTGYQSVTMSGVAGAGVATMYASDTGSNWVVLRGIGYATSLVQDSSALSFSAAGPSYIQFPVVARFMQVRMTTVTTGPATVIVTPRLTPAFSYVPLTGNSRVNVELPATSAVNISSSTTVATTNNQSTSQTIITATAAAVVQVKASAGRITMLCISNGAANVGYLHLQNSATATTATASVMTIAIPATAGAIITVKLPDGGLYLSAGIAFTVSGAIASGDTTALTAPSIAVNISYI